MEVIITVVHDGNLLLWTNYDSLISPSFESFQFLVLSFPKMGLVDSVYALSPVEVKSSYYIIVSSGHLIQP